MSKMSAELKRRLDANKYAMYITLKAFDAYLLAPYPANMGLKKLAVELMDKVINAIEKG